MTEWKAALTAEDLEKVMSAYSENYTSERISSKDEIHQFMVGIFDEGMMDNFKVNLENAVTEIEGDKARFGPVEFNSGQNTMEIDYTLQKEGGAWLIVSSKWLQQ
jgi:ketosteroid isomerase-like protein